MVATLADMYEYVLRGLRKENAGTVYPDDFEVLINGVTLQVVRERYLVSVETDQKRIDDLRELIPPPDVITNTTPGIPGGETFVLPFTTLPATGTGYGYMFMLSVALRMVSGTTVPYIPWPCNTPSGIVLARELRRDQRHVVEQHPYASPTPDEPYYYLTQDRLRVVAGSTAAWASEAILEYVRYPRKLSFTPLVDPELPPHILTEICERAIRKRLETNESRRFDTKLAEDKQTIQ